MLNLEENPKGSTNINDALLNAIDTGKKISDIDRKSIPTGPYSYGGYTGTCQPNILRFM